MSSSSAEDVEMIGEASSESKESLNMSDENEEIDDRNKRRGTYLPGDPLKEGEVLTCDESAYVMLHEAQTGSPCLSFDIVQNSQGWSGGSENFPLTVSLISGTQAPQSHANSIIVMKMNNLHKTQKSESDESEEESEDESEDSKSPQLRCRLLNHYGCVNRVRCMSHENVVLAASWSELGRVHIWDVTSQLKELDDSTTNTKKKPENPVKPLFSFKGHQIEGYGLDWSPNNPGVLASGDCNNGIHIWHPSDGGVWQVDQRPLVGHTQSVEDLQWSPHEQSVLGSCSVDKSIRIWDVRAPPDKANKLTVENAHDMDVNVISWNRNEPFLVSGGDDGMLHVWDLRQFKSNSSVASFKHHTQPVTTVEWHPQDSTVFASGGADNQIALWDLAVERDMESNSEDIEDLPSQLLFIHQGQMDIKELHWHHSFSGLIISTAQSGFNIFKTISV